MYRRAVVSLSERISRQFERRSAAFRHGKRMSACLSPILIASSASQGVKVKVAVGLTVFKPEKFVPAACMFIETFTR